MTMTIALDVMGGDNAPDIVIEGAASALTRMPGLRFLLFGDEPRIRPLLERHSSLAQAVDIRHTTEAIAGDMRPSAAIRHGRNSSMRLTIEAVRAGEAAAAVSAGNTGALMAISVYVLKTLPGIDRPAIASVLPSEQRPVVVLDLGANVDCSPTHLLQFAVMGEVYARAVLGVKEPSIGILNIGTEEMKGDSVVRKAAAMIRDSGLPIAYAGFVEGTDVTEGKVDVVVTDGFTGNVALKIAEGTAQMYSRALRRAFESTLRARLGYLLARPALKRLKEKFDPRLYNGAMFLGINGVIVKSHGGTDALGFAAAVRAAAALVREGTNKRIIDEMGSVEVAEPHAPIAAH